MFKLKSFLPIVILLYVIFLLRRSSFLEDREIEPKPIILSCSFLLSNIPSIRNPQKHSLPACFSYFSIHTTCQPIVNHYCTFFSRYDIFFFFYFTFFNYYYYYYYLLFIYLFIFFCSLILDVPCLYRQPTAKKTTLPLFHPFLPFLSVSRDPNLSLSFSHLSFSRSLSLSRFQFTP